MQVLRHLTTEHSHIRRVLERARISLAPLDRPVMRECLDFFEQFVGAHYRQEEQVLFGALEGWAPDLARGPVQAMQKEHDLARAYLRAALTAVEAGPDQKGRLIESVRRFVEILQEHLRVEDEALFELAHIALPPSRDLELLESMHACRRETLADDEYLRWINIAEDGGQAGTLLVREFAPTDPAGIGDGVMDARSLTEAGEFDTDEETGYSMRSGGVLFDEDGHRAVWLHDFGRGLAVQANQFLIVDDGEGMILDPGGPKVYPDVLAETNLHLGDGKLRYIFLSHQDPDIGTSLNAWLMDTEAEALISKLWVRFLPHFGIDKLLSDRLTALPDRGRWLRLGRRELLILPAHFLHSPGNLQVYDPTSKTLFSGDLGATIGTDESEVRDFEAHRRLLEAFHERYMASNRALRAWVRMVRQLDVECIAPQHGPLYRGKATVERFLGWAETFECGIDALEHLYTLPAR